MGLRPGKTKGPYVGPPAGGGGVAPADAEYVVMALDPTLTDERVLTAGAGISITDGGAGGNATVAATFDRTDILEGDGQQLNNVGAESIEVQQSVPDFHDRFYTARGFWSGKQVLTSGDWQIDTVNHYLEGIAENNNDDDFRYGIEGDWDYVFKMEQGGASSAGFEIEGNAVIARIRKFGTTLWCRVTGFANQDAVVAATDPFWLRMRRFGTTIKFYHKVNDTDGWTLRATFTGVNMGDYQTARLNSADGGFVHEARLWDNSFPNDDRFVPLTDAATIATDASKGNRFSVTLGDNRTLGAPTNPGGDGNMILYRITQDGTGNRTLAYNGIFRFSTDLVSPTLSTGAGEMDYLLFIYHKNDNKWDFVGKVFGF